MQSSLVLAFGAVSVGFLHTVFGPDHYLPFVVMSRARRWSRPKTLAITFLCGLGHVLSSAVVGIIGVALGVAVAKVEVFEGIRGSLAGWALISFGLIYAVWGIRRAVRNKRHTHVHRHPTAVEHFHTHAHAGEHAHVHIHDGKENITPWVLFTIFVFGPCEPLIPLLMYPSAQMNAAGIALVAGLFSAATIITMLAIVLLLISGVSVVKFGPLEKYKDALAGGIIAFSGIAIVFLGL